MEMKKLRSLSDEQILNALNQSIGKCLYSKCGQEVRSSDEKKYVPVGVYHDDCYFAEFGEEIERNPIHSPRRIGIGGCC